MEPHGEASGAKQGDAAVPLAQLAVRLPTACAGEGGLTGRWVSKWGLFRNVLGRF